MSLDVAILSRVNSTGLVPADGGLTEDGITQLAQRVLIELCTDLNSALALPARGTEFLRGLRQRVYSSEYDALTAAAASLATVVDALRAEDSSSDNPASRVASAVLSRLTIAPGSVVLQLQVQSAAGQTSTATFPVRISY
jgi:sirohydrochlorin ferrochelatase